MDKRKLMLGVLDQLDGAMGDIAAKRASGKPILEIQICQPGEEMEEDDMGDEMEDEDDDLGRRLASVSRGKTVSDED